MQVVNQLSETVTETLEYVNSNKIVSAVLGLFLVLYAALAAPKLPQQVTVWFDNTWFKLGYMFMIAYMATRDPAVAIIAAVALLVTLQTLSAHRTTETVVKAVQTKVENFAQAEAEVRSMQEAIAEVQGTPVAGPAPVRMEAAAEVEVPQMEEAITGAEERLYASVAETEEMPAPRVAGPAAEEDAPASCGVSLSEMNGYDGGELATF